MYKVHIVNVKTFKGPHYYVGRPSPLGNPFTIQEHGRTEALRRYKEWLNLQYVTNNQRVIARLHSLAKDLKNMGSITLSCWCAPQDCHATLIGKALITLINRKKI